MLENPSVIDPYMRDKRDLSPQEYVKGKTEAIQTAYRHCYEWLAVSYGRMGDYRKMLEAALGGLRFDRESKDPFSFYVGYAEFKLNLYHKAIGHFEQSLARPQLAGESCRYMALSLKALNNEQLAQEALRHAARFPPDSWESRVPVPQLYYMPPIFLKSDPQKPILIM
jgi:tetratricopeptide (TPR) repeat protein